ncbi:uncharacterized protein LOC141823590 [Curcuma longa]|uniref:uncharacterized protein LOC141823590 n=1 Tax=Curcuma longa TaxID=136217 RepID=UPI003D9F2A70
MSLSFRSIGQMQLFLSRFLETVAVTLFLLGHSISSGDTMIQNSSLVNGQNLTSTGELFQLGFFSLDDSSTKGYFGIWYYNLTPQEGTVVWIANRNQSVNTSMASFNLTSDGNLILFEEDKIVWSTGTRSTGLNSARLQLLDSGNLVLNDSNSILWQSFEHWNSDTYIPGMKYGFDNRTNTSWRQVSWKNSTDPSPGDYIRMMRALPIQDFVTLKGSAKYHRSSLWSVGQPSLSSSPLASSVRPTFVSNENETYFMVNYTASPTPVLIRSVLWANGTLQRWFLDRGGKREWQLLWSLPADECDNYNSCGHNSLCTKRYNTVNCQCLDGFRKIAENGSEAGCQREKPLNCSSNSQFSKVQNVKVPDTENATARGNMSLDDCKKLCLNDCSCVAYAVINGSDGCITWPGDLLDLRTFVDEGYDLYVRLAGKNSTGRRILFIVISIAAALLFLCAIFIYCRRTKATRRRRKLLAEIFNHKDQHEIRGAESLLFDLEAIRIATDNFSERNKLGEGGFGAVYKGTLENGEHVAVKRLSRSSGQGLDELKNEVFLVAKLRHRNLVKLLGCCLESEEKLLVYNYLANTSLDKFLFDNSKRKQLDWPRRFKIIEGISRGLLYLHEDSPLKIIHRDLKASNILLDANMDPKISDFGLAKLFGADETQGNTKRIAGTFGYMAPEYTLHGLFSVKSDVYSYGVLVLEILTGQKNSGYRGSDHPIELVTHVVWRHWTQGSALQVIDQDLVEECQAQQILRCIHIGLLCVQEDPIQRPKMANVVLMLHSLFVTLPTPSAPAFLSICNTTSESNCVPKRENSNGSKGILMKISENDASISTLEPSLTECLASGDTMNQNSSLVNNQTLISIGDVFQMGFFSLDNSSANGYVGIWYYNVTPQEGTVVWIANRNKSVNTSMASLNLTSEGNLILFEEDRIVWSTGTRYTGLLNSARLQLLDSGNLILNDSSNSILWQSFEDSNDSDTYLPGMKLGFDNRTNTSWRQVSWNNSTDPSPGDYTRMIRALPILDVVTLKGSAKYRRSGPLNGYGFLGQVANSVALTFVSNQNETYFVHNYVASPTPVLSRWVFWANGTFQRWSLDRGGEGEWQLLWSVPVDDCDMYNRCGRNSVCARIYYTVNCNCLDGFINTTENGSMAGCEREKPLNCSSNSQFSKVQNVKVPDTENATSRGNMSLDGCKNLCLNDCSCVAYAVINGSYGCITWPGDLLDLRNFVGGGDDLFVRLAGELDHTRKNSTGRRILFIVMPIAAALLFLCVIFIYCRRTKATTRRRKRLHAETFNDKDQDEIRGAESLLFDLEAIRIATDNFSERNKLGEGGFGAVYKGTMENGEHVAVKRLSTSSGQGLDELKNEVFLVAKLRHRNLVKLLGCCLESEEKLLVYSYLANTSLDKFLFDNSKRKQLDWPRRFKIIEGISRGLLYLHEDSPLKIIHRDLKASNILLDANMDPKISDFGLAKLFGANETQGNTKRIAGTFGYMAPEYVIHGLFSVKSDVYSYGVLVLEILIGRKNSDYRESEYPIELVTHVVWRHWTQGTVLQVIDQDLVEQCQAQQILRCIHIGLLCVQEDPIQRPTMANVVLMLNSHFVGLPTPSAPAFLSDHNTTSESIGVPKQENSRGSKRILMKISENNVSISALEPR